MTAQILSLATGLKQTACKKWMRHAGIKDSTQLRDRYGPGVNYHEAMRRAACEIEEFIINGPMTEDQRLVWGD